MARTKSSGKVHLALWEKQGVSGFSRSKQTAKKSSSHQQGKRPGSKHPKTKLEPQTISWSEIPAELRNYIYSYALTDPEPIYLIPQAVDTSEDRFLLLRAREQLQYYRLPGGSWCSSHSHIEASSSDDLDESLLARDLGSAILRLNRATYHEALPFLYAQNQFILSNPLALYLFLLDLGPQASALLTRLKISSWGLKNAASIATRYTTFELLSKLNNLQRLRLNCNLFHGLFGSRRGPVPVPSKLAALVERELRPWMKAIAVARGKVDAAVDVLELSRRNFRRNGGKEAQFEISLRKVLRNRLKDVQLGEET